VIYEFDWNDIAKYSLYISNIVTLVHTTTIGEFSCWRIAKWFCN